jgi:hypothetical protein
MTEAENYKAGRGPAWNAIFDTLRSHRLSRSVDELGGPYPLVDALSQPGTTIETGEWEMIVLADEIALVLNVT